MKPIYTKFLFAMLIIAGSFQLNAQTNVYTVTSGELIFSWADLSFNEAHMAANPDDQQVGNPLRFTAWFHLGQYIHMDFNNKIGIYTGLAFRNVGLISDEKLDVNGIVSDYKIIRRTYNLGLPLALKVGAFDNHIYFFGGGEIEMGYAYKEKFWKANTRSGAKTKYIEWFGNQSELFLPSVFAGVQMPGGVNVKFKYYLKDFLKNDYVRSDPNEKVSDLSRYETSQIMYVSLSWQFNTGKAAKKATGRTEKVAMR